MINQYVILHMENHSNWRCLGTFGISGFLVQSRRRVLLLAVFDVALIVIVVFRWNSRPEPQIKGVWWKISRALNNPQIWDEKKPMCKFPRIGSIVVNYTSYDMDTLQEKYPEVQDGHYRPSDCTPQYKVAIIVPLRGHLHQLSIFLNHMHAFLMKQNLEYGIFIVEQTGTHALKYFNRGMLLNIGFKETLVEPHGAWECVIFHDIDLLPLDLRNIYSCPHWQHPRHRAASIDTMGLNLPISDDEINPYETQIGGVSAFTEAQFIDVNGYSNQFWGTGGEDDDMFYRLNQEKYSVARSYRAASRYASLRAKQEHPDAKKNELLDLFLKDGTKANYKEDGLSDLNTLKYQATTKRFPLYTHIKVDVDAPSLIRIDLTLDEILSDS